LDTEVALTYFLLQRRFHHRNTIDNPECKESLQECTTLAEFLTSSQNLHEAQIRDLESQHGLSHKSIFGLGHTILKTLWINTYNYTLYALDNLCVEYTFNILYKPDNNK
jgi:hypothetical protein